MICLELVGGFLVSLSTKPGALNHGTGVCQAKVFHPLSWHRVSIQGLGAA